MASTTIGRHLAAILIGAAFVVASGGRAAAQCVGDCNGDGEVTINELILGVNIALDLDPVSVCEAFANSQGEVTIAQLILGVNNALNGCPPSSSPTPTETPGATPTPTEPIAGNCTFVTGASQSHLELYVTAVANPLILPLAGSMNVDCTAGEGDSGECGCSVAAIEPIRIPSIGTVCIAPSAEPCPLAGVECAGGDPLGIELRSDGNVGACAGNDACDAACDTHCAANGAERSIAGCTGYCSLGNDVACNTDEECLPDNGACNGPDPVGSNFDICQCTCIDRSTGAAGRDGEMQCNLGVVLTVEAAAPCTGGDVLIDLGTSCIATTTAGASTLMTDANFNNTTVPGNGIPAASEGAPIACTPLLAGELSGLKIRGGVNFFGSALGDLATLFAADCE